MIVTVSGNTSNVTWCGKTWTPAESGVGKAVCPSDETYRSTKLGPDRATHKWALNGYGIKIRKALSSSTNTAKCYLYTPTGGSVSSYLQLNYNSGNRTTAYRFNEGNPTPDFGINVSTLSPATHKFGDNFFNSYTNSNGVTFSWGKSAEWDALVAAYEGP
jgi:hypothetical protein